MGFSTSDPHLKRLCSRRPGRTQRAGCCRWTRSRRRLKRRSLFRLVLLLLRQRPMRLQQVRAEIMDRVLCSKVIWYSVNIYFLRLRECRSCWFGGLGFVGVGVRLCGALGHASPPPHDSGVSQQKDLDGLELQRAVSSFLWGSDLLWRGIILRHSV